MSSGFLLECAPGHAALSRVNLEGRAAALLGVAADHAAAAILLGRLTYRGDLRAALGPAAPPEAEDDDAALALAAYRRFGAAGLERLEGEFALAVLDRAERRVLASRDPSGGYALFWAQRGEALAVATATRPLTRWLGDDALNFDFIAESVMLGYVGLERRPASAFKGVHRVPPGALLTAEIGGAAAVRRSYKLDEHVEDPGTGDIAIVAAEYRARLDRAVAERLRGRVAAHFSGGMDSTSVARLASRRLGARGQRLDALSIVYARQTELKDETPYIDACLAADPSLNAHRIDGDPIVDFEDPEPKRLHDEPYTGVHRAGRDLALAEAAGALGADTALTGFGADELVGDTPFGLADLVRRGRLLAAWRAATVWAEARSAHPWRTFKPFALTPNAPLWLQPGLGAALSGGFAPFEKQNPWTIPSWVRPDFAKRLRLRDRALANLAQTFRGPHGVARAQAVAAVENSAGDWARTHFAAPLGVHVAHPFRDPRLVAYALGARLRVQPSPKEQKRLIARACADVLPDKVRLRGGKGSFNTPFFMGLSKNRAALARMIADSPVDALGLFDKAELTACLNRAALGVDKMRGVNGLLDSLGVVRWLALLPRWRAAEDTLTPIPLGVTAPAQETAS